MKRILVFLFGTLMFSSMNCIAQGEQLMIEWPEEGKWKVGSSQENSKTHMLEIIHGNESIENWTELGTMMSLKGVKIDNIEKVMALMFQQSRQNAPDAKLTLIEKKISTEYPWILFTIEAPAFKNDPNPESQIWYCVQGKETLYNNFIAFKKASISNEDVKKWSKIFLASKIVSQ
jgi:hypothetical protein